MNQENQSSLIGQILVATGKISKEQLEEALEIQGKAKESDRPHKPLGQVLLELDLVQPNDIIDAIRIQVQMRSGNTGGISPSNN